MSIERLGSVDPVSKYQQAERTRRSEGRRPADSVQVSDEAREKAEVLRAYDVVRESEDVRADRVAEVKRKLEDPSYINDAVVNSVADSLLDVFGV